MYSTPDAHSEMVRLFDEVTKSATRIKELQIHEEQLLFLDRHLREFGEVSFGIADGCRCAGCYTFELSEGDLKSPVEGDTLAEAIDKARKVCTYPPY